MRSLLMTAAVCGYSIATAVNALAKPTVDGHLTPGEYGPALFIQNTNTGFGNATDIDPMLSNGGSEMDAIYARITNGRLYVLMTGNLEHNFNKWDLYVDSAAGGVNQIVNEALDPYPSIDPFSGGTFQNSNGLKFDAGFDADYYMTFTNGFETDQTTFTNQWAFTTHFSPVVPASALPANPSPQWGALGGNVVAGLSGGHQTDATEFNPPPPVGFDNFWIERETDNSFIGMEATIDNSNNQGVPGTEGGFAATPESIAAAAAVTTGVEFSIPLNRIGSPAGSLKISTFINGGSHNYISNQVSGGILGGNLGGNGTGGFNGTLNGVDFSTIAADQFVTVNPSLPGDVNFDGVVNIFDVNLVSAHWGESGPAGDANDDMTVNIFDINLISANWTPTGGAAAVPEPSTWVLALLSFVGLAGFARRVRQVRP